MLFPENVSSTTSSTTTVSSVNVPSGSNYAIVLLITGSHYQTTSYPSSTSFTALRNGQTFTEVTQGVGGGYYQYGPACDDETYYWRIRRAILILRNPSVGSYSINISGNPSNTIRSIAYVVRGGNFLDISNKKIDSWSSTRDKYTHSPTNTLIRPGRLYSITRPYRRGNATTHFSMTAYTVSPTDYEGMHSVEVTPSSPNQEYSWVPSTWGYSANLYLSSKALVPQFAFH
jgi:hypothetical protein